MLVYANFIKTFVARFFHHLNKCIHNFRNIPASLVCDINIPDGMFAAEFVKYCVIAPVAKLCYGIAYKGYGWRAGVTR